MDHSLAPRRCCAKLGQGHLMWILVMKAERHIRTKDFGISDRISKDPFHVFCSSLKQNSVRGTIDPLYLFLDSHIDAEIPAYNIPYLCSLRLLLGILQLRCRSLSPRWSEPACQK